MSPPGGSAVPRAGSPHERENEHGGDGCEQQDGPHEKAFDNAVVAERAQLRTYECDGLASYRVIPLLVVLPQSTDQVQAAVRICHQEGIPFVARGAGTGLSGGALPVADEHAFDVFRVVGGGGG